MLETIVFSGVCCIVAGVLVSGFGAKKSTGFSVAAPHTQSQLLQDKSASGLTSLIDEADKLSRRGCVNVNVVLMENGSMQMLSDFQMVVQKKEIAERIYSTDETTGNHTFTDAVLFLPHAA